MRLVAVASLMLAGAHAAVAQDFRGTVRDSLTGEPISGAVVMLLDAAGATLRRNLTNQRGEYRLAPHVTARRMRVVRLGFAPREILVAPGGSPAVFEIRMVSISTLLDTVRVSAAASCTPRPDRASALALLRQARAGLLTTVVAQESRPAQMSVLRFDRTMDGTSNRIDQQTVQLVSAERTRTSFAAGRTASEFVRWGFLLESEGERMYFGPDAHTLLEDAFARGYCFHLRERGVERPDQVGLAFTPARRVRGRVDIDGTLWVDTVRRELRDLEFRYLGLPPASDAVKPGGIVSFWEMDNGVVFIDRWSFRLPATGRDTAYGRNNRPIIRSWPYARENGGEVAKASWSDADNYHAPLGTLYGRAVDIDGKPVASGVIRLVGTDYVASPDSAGYFEINDLLPGPYVAAVIDPTIASLEMTLPTALRFVAARDSVHRAQVLIPSAADYVRPSCLRPLLTPSGNDKTLLTGRVQTLDKAPAGFARVELSKDHGVAWQRVTEVQTADAEGRFEHCMRIEPGEIIALRAWIQGGAPWTGSTRVARGGTKVTITLPGPSPRAR